MTKKQKIEVVIYLSELLEHYQIAGTEKSRKKLESFIRSITK